MRIFLLLIFALLNTGLAAQIGGDHTYAFLNLTTSARAAALGGKTIAVDDKDLNLSFHNPALLKEDMGNRVLFNYVNYFTDINYGYTSYSFQNKKDINFAAGIQYMNYGEFQGADKFGMKTGTFKAADYAFHLMASKSIDTNVTVGITVKPLYSHLEEYHSIGLAADLGVSYTDTSGLFTAALVLKNMGIQLKPYHADTRESLPFEIQLGFSLKLRHAPFRFITTIEHLETPNLRYPDPNAENTTLYDANTQPQSTFDKNFDKLMRHMIFGVEFTPLKNFYLRVGYNYRKRKEMQVPSRPATVGFSWGMGIKLFDFYLSYGSADYHLAGNTNHFSLRTDLNRLFSK